MIQIDNTIISDDLVQERFACHVKVCKGACCVDGDSGAPLEKEELTILKREFSNFENFMRPEGLEEIKKQGLFIKDSDGDFVTPLVNERECAYAVFTPEGVAHCAIEKAYHAGKIKFLKPVSCHLYPVRITENKLNISVNYQAWSICEAGRIKGDFKNIRLYEFLKSALIRKFGKEWYEKLNFYAKAYADK